MTRMFRLESEQLLLRPVTIDDVGPAYLGWMNDPEVNQYLESRYVEQTLDSLADFVRSVLADERNVFAAIVRKSDGVHVGNIKLGPIDQRHRTGDIGLVIGERSAWGHGYATEAIAAITAFAFEELGLQKVTASAYGANMGSVRAFEKAGFEREGVRRSQFQSGDRREDGVLLGRVRPAADPS
jgi:[ribosomal protein S5]-alanine N-acetyltransferase